MNVKQKLVTLGIMSNLDGFHYIVESVSIIRESGKSVRMKEIYPVLAERFPKQGITHFERSMRSAITTAQINEDSSTYYSLSQFLHLLAHDLI